MNLVTSIYKIEDINLLKDYLDYALINVPKYSINYKNIDVDKAIKLCDENNIKVILSINRIMHPGDLNNVEELINKYKDKDVLFYIADLGVLNILKKYDLLNKVIYNPETMITNYLDLKLYNDMVLACGVSNEITLEDLKLMYDKTNSNIFYQGFGLRLMFYSRRKLISLYGNKNNTTYPKENVYLREITRTDYMPIIENEENTLIYRPYYISLLDKLNEIKFVKFLYIESFNIDMDLFKDINRIYFEAINNDKLLYVLPEFNSLKLNIEDGFIYKDSVYQKEELKK